MEERLWLFSGEYSNVVHNKRIALEIDATNARFHAVHRVGKTAIGKAQLIFARYVRCEDRGLVSGQGKKI